MTEIAVFATALAKPLNRRRRVSVELPEVVIRAIAYRVDEANDGDTTAELVDFNDVVEWLLVSEVTIRRMPHLERSIPGFTAAMFEWVMSATYQPPRTERQFRACNCAGADFCHRLSFSTMAAEDIGKINEQLLHSLTDDLIHVAPVGPCGYRVSRLLNRV